MKLGIYCDSSVNGGHEEMLKRLILALVNSPRLKSLHILVPTENRQMSDFVHQIVRKHRHVAITLLRFTSESVGGSALATSVAAWRTSAMLRSLALTKLLIAQGTIVSAHTGLIAARLARITAVTYIPLVDDVARADTRLRERIKLLVKRVIYRLPDQYITLNDHLRERLGKQAPRTPVAILENTVDSRFGHSAVTKEEARRALGLPVSGTFICAHIGRIHFQHKRQRFLLEAIERNPGAFANSIVLIVGEGPDADELRLIVQRSKLLARCVRIIGSKPDVLPYILATDVVVLPSAYEGVPLVMIESVLAGRPIVASDVSALRSYLPDELLFPVDDHDAFVERIFSAPAYPLADLTASFRHRFSREVFDAQVQQILLQPVPQDRAAKHLEHNASDLRTK